MLPKFKYLHGYTLIELVVVVTIVLAISSLGLANYNKYNDSQRLKQAAKTFRNNIRLAQTKARSADIPDSTACPVYVGYVLYYIDSSSYGIKLKCRNGGSDTYPLYFQWSFNLPQTVEFNNSFSDIVYQADGALPPTSNITINGVTDSININSSGEITE